jgi:hypothetical protein
MFQGAIGYYIFKYSTFRAVLSIFNKQLRTFCPFSNRPVIGNFNQYIASNVRSSGESQPCERCGPTYRNRIALNMRFNPADYHHYTV